MAILNEIGDRDDIALSYHNMAQLKLKLGQIDRNDGALYLAHLSLQIAQESGSTRNTKS